MVVDGPQGVRQQQQQQQPNHYPLPLARVHESELHVMVWCGVV